MADIERSLPFALEAEQSVLGAILLKPEKFSLVAESLKEAVKYKVERFTGMIVNTVNVNVIGVKL